MDEQYQPIRDLLGRVRARWRRLVFFHATIRGALAAAAALAVVLFLTSWTSGAPRALAALGVVGVILVLGALFWGLWPAREVPSDGRVARFVEERAAASLDDRLVSAVDVLASPDSDDRPGLARSMVADAARASTSIDPAAIVPPETLRRAGFQAAAAALLLIVIGTAGWSTARQSFDALALALFPSRVVLEVTPGNARVEAGSGLTVAARLVGNRAPVVARLLRADGPDDDTWRAAEMQSDAAGHFTIALGSLGTSFRYRVVAGAVTSPTFNVAVVRAPRVTRIDVEYSYPKALGLAPRVEEDGGDIYAPAGTDVRVRVHTDKPAATGRMVLGGANAQPIALAADGENVLAGSLQVVDDNSYRVALADAEGLTNRGDTEYFIRTLEDRPPDVHVLKPASDRRVTRLEEIDIEAEAQDDFGLDRLDLVYAVRGGTEKVVPLGIPKRATSATGRHTLYLEDLNVQPGDFVTYYVRARDLARGKRASESRSDIFFLEVKPFEEEFTLAQSQAAMGGGGGNRQLDDLVGAQKEIIVATWKLDRRAEASRGGKSEQDIRSVGRAEGELKTRVEETSSSFRESTMRDPRRRQPQGGRGGQPQPDTLRAGQTLPEEDAMTAAATAMGKAEASLNALKTADALPSEMTALNHLLKAQAEVKKRQVQRQQAGSGAGSNRSTQDLSSLFDKELARHQQTNYETPTSTEQHEDANASALDKIKDLARRQDELLKRQQELARQREKMTAEDLKRELEKLTRDQNELREKAEQLAQQMAKQQSQQSGQESNPQTGKQAGQNQPGQKPGQQSQSGQQSGQQGQSGQQPGQEGQPGQQQSQSAQAGENGRQMRDVSEEMRSAASDLRRQDASQASERAARALEKLREIERQLQSGSPDARRRALGDLELEARQLADGQRQIASEANRAGQGQAGKDTLRRLGGEQDRLGERLKRVQDGLKQQAGAPSGAAGDAADAKNLQRAAGDASREIERQRLDERMRQSAEAMRAAAAQAGGKGTAQEPSSKTPTGEAQDQIARALDNLADKLAAAGDSRDEKSRKLSGQLARAQQLRERLDSLTKQLEQLGQGDSPNGAKAGSQPTGQQGGRQNGQSSQSQSSPGPTGKAGQGQGGAIGSATDVAQLREQANRQIQELRELLNELQREDATYAQGGAGFTFEGQGMTLSAPGTEAFKNDFAKWQEMNRHATQALERVESTLARKLQESESKDRLAAGADDKAPAEYQKQVDSYFKALAAKKK